MVNYNLNDLETIKGFKNELDLISEEDNISKAFKFFYYLEKILNIPRTKSSLIESSLLQYRKMIVKAKFIALFRLSQKEILKLLNDHFEYIFNIERYDPWKKIKDYLTELNSLGERDKFKETLRKILNKNKTFISNNKLIINNKEEQPTISNWLKDFRTSHGEDYFIDQMKISDYLIRNSNIQKLTKEEKKKVNLVLDLYRKLKFSSFSPVGLEEEVTIIKPDGEMGTLKEGQFEKISKETEEVYQKVVNILGNRNINYQDRDDIINELKLNLNQYPSNSLERKAIEEEIKKMNTES